MIAKNKEIGRGIGFCIVNNTIIASTNLIFKNVRDNNVKKAEEWMEEG